MTLHRVRMRIVGTNLSVYGDEITSGNYYGGGLEAKTVSPSSSTGCRAARSSCSDYEPRVGNE